MLLFFFCSTEDYTCSASALPLALCLLIFFFLSYIFWVLVVVLAFELRASCLQSKHSTAWAITPVHFVVLIWRWGLMNHLPRLALTMILPISAQVARITGMRHHRPAYFETFLSFTPFSPLPLSLFPLSVPPCRTILPVAYTWALATNYPLPSSMGHCHIEAWICFLT
jgi:hypothetical protein